LILAAFTPVFLWLKYLQERVGPITPAMPMALAFLAGLLISLPALLIQTFLDRSPNVSFAWLHGLTLVELVTLDGLYGYVFVRAYVLGGLVEEGLKLLTILGVLLCFRSKMRPAALIVIAVAVGGAFAAVENILVTAGSLNWGRIAILRALVSVPNHVFLGVIMGFFLLLSWKGRWRFTMACLAFAVPALLHGTSNYLLYLGEPEVTSPGIVEATARQLYGGLFLFLAVGAVLILSWVSRWDGRGAEQFARPRSFARRRAFWAPVSLIVGVFGVLNLLIIIAGPGGSFFALNIGSTFLIGALSLLYAVVIWGHAHHRAPLSRAGQSA
jgi:RsiW-degrading membrane proteinase PrsW (M82 family)